MMKSGFRNLLLGLWAMIFSCGIMSCSKDRAQPNIVFILVDDMGYGDLACFNPASGISTPNIDGLAEAGIRFTDAHASGALCHPSRYGLLTGCYPFRMDVSVWRKHATIKEGQLTIASMLKEQGYKSAMVGKWHLGFEEIGYENALRGGPVDHGFDSYFGMRASTDIPPYFYIRDDKAVLSPTDTIEASSTEGWSPIQGAFWRSGGIAPEFSLENVLPDFTNEAISVIADFAKVETQNEPLFLYLAYPSPHTPWLPDSAHRGRSKVGLYGDFVEMVDDQVAGVLAALTENGMDDNTIVFFSSDNGPVWYEEDVEHFGHDASGGFRGMKGDAWEAGHRMPFIVKWQGEIAPGTESDVPGCFTDVLSTLAEITTYSIPEGYAEDSYSFLSLLKGVNGDGEYKRPPIVIESANGAMSIRSGKWKLINQLGSGGFSKPGYMKAMEGEAPCQLYNMVDDPRETTNLYLENIQLADSLLLILESYK